MIYVMIYVYIYLGRRAGVGSRVTHNLQLYVYFELKEEVDPVKQQNKRDGAGCFMLCQAAHCGLATIYLILVFYG